MSSLDPGMRLAGRFQLQTRLAAACWLALDLESGERRMLKIAADPGGRVRLAREAELLAALAHPGLVTCHGTATDGPQLLLLLEYLPGGDLRAMRRGPWRASVAALAPALAALDHAHAHGVAHGDLKPANLVRAADGGARLVDFGVAAGARAGVVVRGSPYSRSPAQWDGTAATPADDLYGLGALLYELASGQPPFYPDVDARRAATEVPPPLTGVPPPLAALVGRLLSKDPAGRGELALARAELAAAAAVPEPLAMVPPAAAGPSSPPSRPLAPPGWQPSAAAPPDGGAVERGSRRVAALLLLLGAAALAVFALLPRYMRDHPPQVQLVEPPAAPVLAARQAAQPKALPSTPEALAELARGKTRAEDARASFEAARGAADATHAELWGGADFAALTAAAAAAEAQYRDRDYDLAAGSWSTARAALERVRAARAPALAATLATGRAAFERGDAAAASAAFARAAAIAPADKTAAAWLERAHRLDRVTVQMDAAASLEKAGDLQGAAQGYRAALALDPATVAASAGLTRLAARGRANAFAATMAQGQKALASGDRARARAAFDQALATQPDSAEAKDALAALTVSDQAAAIARLHEVAEAAVRDERWSEAARDYNDALAQDPTLAFAQAGKAAAEPRAELAARLERFVAAPERLYAPESRAEARVTLASARASAAEGGPAVVLRRQVAALEHALAAAETPVRVPLVSDGVTEVVVYRVGRLGAFAARELEVLPGRYTIVGRRTGFRDVRRELEIPPGPQAPAAVDIRCTEPI